MLGGSDSNSRAHVAGFQITDREQLFAAILASPDDDLARLAYADCLEEQWPREGGVTDDTDLAELIRCSVEVTKCHPTCGVGKVCRGVDSPYGMTCAAVRDRGRELLAAHPEWVRDLAMPCPGCGGTGRRQVDAPVGVALIGCETCGGTGDLLKVFVATAEPLLSDDESRNPILSRGLTLAVECRLDEVVREYLTPVDCPYCKEEGCERCDGRGTIGFDDVWQPTPWALAYRDACVRMGRVPWWRVTDREPYHVGPDSRFPTSGPPFWRWWCFRNEAECPEEYRRSLLPEPVYELLRLGQHQLTTPEAARHALELALYRFVTGLPNGH